MQPAYLSGDAFLSEVRSALGSGRQRLWWLGQSGFLVVSSGRALVVDPYLSDSLTRKYAATDKPHLRLTERVIAPEVLATLSPIALITSSHMHTDHMDAETLTPLLKGNPTAKLLLPAANKESVLERLGAWVDPAMVCTDEGGKIDLSGFTIHAVAAAHNTVERDSQGRCRFLGYVIDCDGTRIYHSGDTLMHGHLVPSLRPLSPHIALLPINGNLPERRVAGNLDGLEAAKLAHDIGARLVVPCHFDMFAFNTANPDLFIAECKRLNQPFRILRNGEGLDLKVPTL